MRNDKGPGPRRPELLSRIGDNIVVFDFISPAVGRDLVAKYLAAVARRVQSRYGVTLRISDGVAEVVSTHALDNLRFGGRGIGSAVETVFVNPLTRALVDRSLTGGNLDVVGLELHGATWSMTVRPGPDR